MVTAGGERGVKVGYIERETERGGERERVTMVTYTHREIWGGRQTEGERGDTESVCML